MHLEKKIVCSLSFSVDLDNGVDFPHEPEASNKADGPCMQRKKEKRILLTGTFFTKEIAVQMLTCEDGEEQGDDECVTKEEEIAERPADVGLEEEVVDRETQQVEPCGPSGEERAPPPAVVLAAEVEVAQQDASLRTHDDEDDEGEEHETKHVVHLPRPVTERGDKNELC